MPTGLSSLNGRLQPPRGAEALVNLIKLKQDIESSDKLVTLLKHALRPAGETLAKRFWDDESVELLVQSRAWIVEQILILVWRKVIPVHDSLAPLARSHESR